MSRRPARPLNKEAVRAADKELYSSHAGDRRPNALFDAAGNRKPLDPNDPTQAGLRKEWMDAYLREQGKTEEKPPEADKPVDCPVEPCPDKLAALTVTVKYTPYEAPVREATVELSGPSPGKGVTDASGVIEFKDLLPGGYTIDVSYEKKHRLVDMALSHVGLTQWAVAASRPPYPSGANKCNLFVYEMGNASEHSIPRRTRWSWSEFGDVWYPPLAGEWADDSKTIGSWSAVTEADAQPGDMVAEAVNYSNATGHVGIISYPEPSGMSRQLAPEEQAFEEILLQRRVISAASDEVLNNDYFWSSRRKSVPHYKRYK